MRITFEVNFADITLRHDCDFQQVMPAHLSLVVLHIVVHLWHVLQLDTVASQRHPDMTYSTKTGHSPTQLTDGTSVLKGNVQVFPADRFQQLTPFQLIGPWEISILF